MQARLKNGDIVELENTCGCLTHTGPHWLHMDNFARQKNLELLQAAQAFMEKGDMLSQMRAAALLDRCALLEIERLKELELEFKRLGIEEIIRDV